MTPAIADTDVDVIGLIRFSMLVDRGAGAWNIGRARAPEDYLADLFSPARLERRFALFEAITLPSLDAQGDGRFSVHAMTSDRMPERYHDRLAALAEGRPYLRIGRTAPDVDVRAASAAILRGAGTARARASFRLDDDDGLSHAFVGALRAAAAARPHGTVISFADGLYARPAADGRRVQVARIAYPGNAQGLALLEVGDDPQSVFSIGSHSKIDRDGPGIVRTDRPMWLRAVHTEADSQMAGDVFRNHVGGRRSRLLDPDAAPAWGGGAFPRLRLEAMLRAMRL